MISMPSILKYLTTPQRHALEEEKKAKKKKAADPLFLVPPSALNVCSRSSIELYFLLVISHVLLAKEQVPVRAQKQKNGSCHLR